MAGPLLMLAANAYASCWVAASEEYGIPVSVLKAVAKTESGFNPAARNRNTNGTHDIGIMQINSSWLPRLERYGITEESLKEPCTNVKVGAWILSNNARKLGWNWNAIGAYNVGCAKLDAVECERRRNQYAWKIHAALSKVGDIESPPGIVGSYRHGATAASNAIVQGVQTPYQAKKIVMVNLGDAGQSVQLAYSAPDHELRLFSPGAFLNYDERRDDE